MLVLTRKIGESIIIGEDIKITVTDIHGRQVRLGVEAPRDIPIYRMEVYERIKKKRDNQLESLKKVIEGWRRKLGGEKDDDGR